LVAIYDLLAWNGAGLEPTQGNNAGVVTKLKENADTRVYIHDTYIKLIK